MFSLAFNFIFSILSYVLYGLFVYILFTLGVATSAHTYEVIRRAVKKKIQEDSLPYNKKGSLHEKNVIVTGGSSGIGKSVALLTAREGANVTLIARDSAKLESTLEELSKCRTHPEQRFDSLSLDVASGDVETTFARLEQKQGPCHMLICCAGTAICGKIEDTPPETLRRLLELNLVGSYRCARAVVPAMKIAKEGRIVLVGSQASLIGIFGFTAYSATKFGVRGLAESLAMELAPYNVSVTLSLPPDTDTPGFAAEEESKPIETKLMSETAGLAKPEEVAEKLLYDASDGKFFSTIGLESFMLTNLCAGMSTYSSISELVLQIALMGPFRLISAFILHSFHSIVVKCMREREKHKKSE
ncbi:hypothetical protein QAD02_003900 [Eretmocerus hayati]|uniref:Uncharacterized protein n=1 Tax=Eretmocerus hayati TaxID=131215 RepID=A0ACC2NPV6_9HYME|nr:hypothetical protein QAD02_003900 [Eretmocerus hayati]